MSRSFKKNAIIKDKNRGAKQLAHQSVRTRVRVELNSNKDYDEMLFPTRKGNEVVNQWDICDWKFKLPTSGFFYYNYRQGKLIYNKVTPKDIRRYTNK
jgi:hypothetical protein